ncbi:MAG TPA: arsenate reductase ArsC, partial [Dehalococcoidia bacterium]
FLCTGNSARSQMAEALLRHYGGGRFAVCSAGTEPKGVHPLTVRVLAELGLPTDGLVSKSLDRYLDQPWDYVITVCDRAAESCPVFPGAATRLHWSFPDPAAVPGSPEARLAAFRAVRDAIAERVRAFVQGARERRAR